MIVHIKAFHFSIYTLMHLTLSVRMSAVCPAIASGFPRADPKKSYKRRDHDSVLYRRLYVMFYIVFRGRTPRAFDVNVHNVK